MIQKEIGAMVGMTVTGICRSFQRVGGLFPKKRALYKEADLKTKEEFLEKISSISRDNLVYVNESGIQKYLYKPEVRLRNG
ncbi:hypothetical protein MIDIC_250009 [Alphaproteobacteria bacterium]